MSIELTDLSAVKAEAIARLLAGENIAAVARGLDIHRSTIYQWQKSDPKFAEALAEYRRQQNQYIGDALSSFADDALFVLQSLVNDTSGTPSIRLRSALGILKEIRHNPTQSDTSAKKVSKPPADHRPCTCGSGQSYGNCCGKPTRPVELHWVKP